jgi:hypothetical protein
MRRLSKILLGIFWLLASVASAERSAFAASSEADFKQAYAAADAAEKEAGRLRNQWLPTEAALAGARKAAERNDFDQAVSAAKEAEALAKASIFQATGEEEAWKNLEIRP